LANLAITKELIAPSGQVFDTNRSVTLTGATVLNVRQHADKPIILNNATGFQVTLPAAIGSGAKFEIHVGTTVTSGSMTIKVANSTDVMNGLALQSQDAGATLQAFETAASDDTITFNGTTTGGIIGDKVELVDAKPGFWLVQIRGAATGTEATPFSATV
jgi:hypothetical protein